MMNTNINQLLGELLLLGDEMFYAVKTSENFNALKVLSIRKSWASRLQATISNLNKISLGINRVDYQKSLVPVQTLFGLMCSMESELSRSLRDSLSKAWNEEKATLENYIIGQNAEALEIDPVVVENRTSIIPPPYSFFSPSAPTSRWSASTLDSIRSGGSVHSTDSGVGFNP